MSTVHLIRLISQWLLLANMLKTFRNKVATEPRIDRPDKT